MSKSGKKGLRGFRIFLRVIVGAILLLSMMLLVAGYSAEHPEQVKALYGKLLGEQGDALAGGTKSQAVKTAEAGFQKMKEMEEVKELEEPEGEQLPYVDPALRLENTVDFAALWEENEDVYAWIVVPGTMVDYPVLQHPTDNEYYLTHTIDHVEGLPGSVYSENLHPKDFSAANTILYGHNMRNGSMFGSLHNYENGAFFDGHPYVYIHLPDRTLLYQIFSAVKFRGVYLPTYLNFEEEQDFQAYVEELKVSTGYMNPDMEPSFGDHLLTLHTCVGNDGKYIYLVVAVLVGAYERE